MTSALRLATLSYAIALVDAGLLFWSGGRRDAGNWGPARHTATVGGAAAEKDPVGWIPPKPTAPPGAMPFDIDLRRRQQTTTVTSAATCGYPVSNVNESAISCNNGEYCYENQFANAAGCCGEANRRDCRVPTTCIESSRSATYSSDPRTLICNDTAKPRCVTYLYNANFFENLNGVSFLACGKDAGSSTIATSPPPGWSPTSDTSTAPEPTDSDPTIPVTVTVFPSSSASSSSTPVPVADSSKSRTGAIAGGVVGGVAGLALIIAAIFFLWRRFRRVRDDQMEGKGMEGSPPYPGRDYRISSVYPGGIPEPQYQSDFYGELPPQMIQTDSMQHVTGYPQPPQASYDPVSTVPRDMHPQGRATTTFIPISPKPNEDDIVSPITPGDGLNPADDPATYTWISNPTPPPQSEYSQFSPPPPPHFQSYRPYPGT
ncbi:uncharacterized protein GGS22DRAFT_190574 [Annulohypoxylon maeteangense]|uniref:uncharacterized protein n=1 Tax=Annulohypoxylon maeteangense TaxID=1927788 RepID=UPI00200851E6|nr:uncharacterized protein GGS22DRAFT_190574 [Annulohypoxylon maeteangense]KAI0883258.1 hypothetical protein GGS22DRAFT_190574 [Annulohypoxylon maeteangense]